MSRNCGMKNKNFTVTLYYIKMLGNEYPSRMGAMRNHEFYSERYILVSRFRDISFRSSIVVVDILQCALGTSKHKIQAAALLPSVKNYFKLPFRSLSNFRASTESGK